MILDADEQRFLDAIRAEPDDDTLRLVYADWLEERGREAEAKYLRVEIDYALARFRRDRAKRRELRNEMTRARTRIPDSWIPLVARTEIENCRWSLRFDVECPLRWESLDVTEDESTRHCSACAGLVHFCSTLETAATLADLGSCVAVEASLPRSPNDLRRTIREVRMGRVVLPRPN